MNDWRRMSNQELHESGLLWHINEAVLWPLGVALTVVQEEDGTYATDLYVQKTEPFEPIVSGASSEDTDKHADVFAAWMRARLG